MKILTADQMARLDRLSIHKHKIPAKRLMYRAAQACCQILLEEIGRVGGSPHIVILCGPGNNGGDGLAMSSILRSQGIAVSPFFTGKAERLSQEARSFFQKLHPGPQPLIKKDDLKKFHKELKTADWIVDALFGTGLGRPLGGIYREIIKLANRTNCRKIAVDIPSGISGNTGEVLGTAFQAERTVTFELPKWGQLQPSAWDFVGKLTVRPIGLSSSEIKAMSAKAEYVDPSMIKKYFRPRKKASHKGKAGRVLVLAGSSQMPGAGYLSARAALRAGAGLVTWAMPEEAFQRIDLKYPEVILHALPSRDGRFAPEGIEDLLTLANKFDALAFGPGLGQGEGVECFFRGILPELRVPWVLDADGINLLAKNPNLYRYQKGGILTPHPKEMSRLCGKKTSEVLKNRIGITQAYSKKYHAWIVLKGYRSVMAGPKGEIFINSTGGPNLAVAGSGDVLTGAIASMLAQGMKSREALLSGVFLHGRAGDLLAEKLGDRGTLPSEIADQLPQAIQEVIS